MSGLEKCPRCRPGGDLDSLQGHSLNRQRLGLTRSEPPAVRLIRAFLLACEDATARNEIGRDQFGLAMEAARRFIQNPEADVGEMADLATEMTLADRAYVEREDAAAAEAKRFDKYERALEEKARGLLRESSSVACNPGGR